MFTKNKQDPCSRLQLNMALKKKDIKLSDDENEHISRIRQLLAAAWSEDLKE